MSPSDTGSTGSSGVSGSGGTGGASSGSRAKKAPGTKVPTKAASAKAAASDDTNPAGVAVESNGPPDRLTKKDPDSAAPAAETAEGAEDTHETVRMDAVTAAAFAAPAAAGAAAANGAPTLAQTTAVQPPATPQTPPTGDPNPYAGSMGTGAPMNAAPVTATPVAASVRPSMARRARLKVQHMGPLSVLRISLTFSLCMFIVLLVAVAALWVVLDSSGVFKSIVNAATTLTNDTKDNHSSVADWLSFSRVMLIAIVLGAANVIAFTMLSTIGALLYNLCSDFVGGIEVTLVER